MVSCVTGDTQQHLLHDWMSTNHGCKRLISRNPIAITRLPWVQRKVKRTSVGEWNQTCLSKARFPSLDSRNALKPEDASLEVGLRERQWYGSPFCLLLFMTHLKAMRNLHQKPRKRHSTPSCVDMNFNGLVAGWFPPAKHLLLKFSCQHDGLARHCFLCGV